jgi:hypothetical protein
VSCRTPGAESEFDFFNQIWENYSGAGAGIIEPGGTMDERDYLLEEIIEKWPWLPPSLKIKIFAIVVYFSWRRWTWEAWLKWNI